MWFSTIGRKAFCLESLWTRKNLHTVRCRSHMACDAARAFIPGEMVHGYRVNKVTDVPEFYLTAVLLEHEKTGAQHLHIARDDDNNAFSVMFRTTPMDSTGVPHILEHTVLCGSESYPVRDPFFKMLSRCLATFMNAMTAFDWTMYPFATQNMQDYRNLLSVYLDAVFRPLIREHDFCQEGWRLEPEDLNDPDSPCAFKGVVYNEMKGVYSSSQNIFTRSTISNLFPSHTYSFDFGGDPKCIPSLTWEQLKMFHFSHYHPSNSRFYTYGNFPLIQHLKVINSHLCEFVRLSPNTSVPSETRWLSARHHAILCSPDPLAADQSKQTTVAVNFLLSRITDTYKSFQQQIICKLLTDGELAPFYGSLIDANIGFDYAPSTGFQGNTKEASFAVGLQGICEADVDKVIGIIDRTLDEVVDKGFDQDRIQAILHQIELGQKHQTSNFGCNLVFGLASHWNHDGDPIDVLQVNQLVERFRCDLSNNPQLLQDEVCHYFKKNSHRLTLTMSPDSEYLQKEMAAEKDREKKASAELSNADRVDIVARGRELLEKQTQQEDLSCLPSLKLADVDTVIKEEPVENHVLSDVHVQHGAQPTNGVVYVQFSVNLPHLPDHLLSMVPLFCTCITSVGAGGHDYRWMSQQAEMLTGGFVADTHVHSHHTEQHLYRKCLVFSSYCLERNFSKMMELWSMIFSSPDFTDRSRLTTLIQMCASELASSVADSGNSYAVMSSASALNPAAAIKEQFDGITQVALMRRISELSDLSDAVGQLQELTNILLNKQSIRVAVNSTPEYTSHCLREIEMFLSRLPGVPLSQPVYSQVESLPKGEKLFKQYQFPFSINFMSRSVLAVPYTHPDRVPLSVLGTLLSRMYLHREIREKGGAYGSGASIADGVFSFFSYRDPHSLKTLEVFEDSIRWAGAGMFSSQQLEESKINVFQMIDKPVVPSQYGTLLFLNHIDDQLRQQFRNRLFSVAGEDVIRVASRYLASGNSRQGTCCIGPTNDAFLDDDRWSVVQFN